MLRLVIRHEELASREIVLRPGLNRIGRNDQNDHPIPNPSISGFHCEIEVGEEGVRIRDLGSTNGTFIDDAPVGEGFLEAGQSLRLGEVKCDVVEAPSGSPADAPGQIRVPVPASPPTEAPEAEVPAAASSVACVHHPGLTATHLCRRCAKLFCRNCLKWLRVGMKLDPACPDCGGFCLDLEAVRKEAARREATFFRLLPGTFSYPFKRNGLILLICGTVFFALLELAQMVLNRLGIAYLLLAYWITVIMSSGYLFAFMQNIIVSSVHGEEQMPPFPEVTNFVEGFFSPAFRLFAIGVVLCGPGLLAMIFVHPLVGLAILLLGFFCVPMAFLTVALADSLSGLNPLVIFSGIAKLPGAYLVVCLIFLVSIAVQAGAGLLLNLTGVPILPTVLGTFIMLYLVTVEMRSLGLLYYTNKKRLAWFR
jgi:FHA domain